MKIISRTFFIALALISHLSSAQQVTKRDTLNGTELIMTMDTKISNELSDLEEKCLDKKDRNPNFENGTKENNKIVVPNRALTNEEICRKNPRISGFKIQVVVVKSNDEANKIRSDFRTKFPYLKVEIDASLRPNYKILAGSYFTKTSAASDLKSIRKQYNTAVPIQYRIFCVEAK
ncbi:SPOR domain-containing protein [Amniculibacterium aquaticum]|jgi:hypothetical protein|uniref:SPOR domain-containing protein n=1 Tax=Amniculibacterium aquaticum TaxID=2479858 RepID=UPI000F5A57BD|nr:SPOR domain-containing protein [Amniculibacterium aquaticum]